MPSLPDPTTANAADEHLLETLGRLERDVGRLLKTVLKHGHAQELFQQRIEETVGRLAGAASPGERTELSGVQLRALLELDRSVAYLHDLARGERRREAEGLPEDAPASMREGLDLLQIRVRNLERSFGLEPIPTVGQPFDDRLHQVHSVCHRPGLPEGRVVEEILPGYSLHGKVVRPALVVVNRNEPQAEEHDE